MSIEPQNFNYTTCACVESACTYFLLINELCVPTFLACSGICMVLLPIKVTSLAVSGRTPTLREPADAHRM